MIYQISIYSTYSICENEEEIPEGWFLSFDDHPTLTKVKLRSCEFNTESLKYIVTNLVKLEELEFDRENCPKFQYADSKQKTRNSF